MGVSAIFDGEAWARVPFHFWSVVFFTFGSMVGSFLNVCIYRMPLGLSVVSPPSHCPHCKYSIPWFLNVPLLTWLSLKGKCKNCAAPISPRYFLVELLTGVLFLACWLKFGDPALQYASMPLALAYCLLMAGFVVATFIDFEHFIIPDEITLGGCAAGFLISFFLPPLHGQTSVTGSLLQSMLGIAVGAGVVYAILRTGKFLFGKQKIDLPGETIIVFSETALHLPDQEFLYEDLFYRKSDTVAIEARTVELVDRCYHNTRLRLSPNKLVIGDEELDPHDVAHLEAVCTELVLPREAMGFGDVKFMAAIGAFLGWEAVLFSLMVSSIIGAMVGVALIVAGKREWSSRLPYGPYIAMAAVIWVFAGKEIVRAIFQHSG